MKKKVFFLLALILIYFACTNTDPNLVTITGKITNPLDESASFQCKDTIYSTTVMEDGTFEITFYLDSSKYIDFHHGVEQTAMYVIPGDNISLTIDTRQFDETINYQNSPTSNFLAKKYLWWETIDFYGEEYYLLSNNEYKALLDGYKGPLLNELSTITDSSFIKYELLELDHRLGRIDKRQKGLQEEYWEH